MRILVVDDEEKFALLTAEHLHEAGHKVTAVTTGQEAVDALAREPFDAVVTDLRMDPVDGMAVLEAAKKANPETGVVVMTAYGTVENAVQAMRRGAYDFVTKPFSLDELVLVLERLGERSALRKENVALRQELNTAGRFTEMVGTSQALKCVQDLINKVAPSDASVLVLGESGVGKELVARMIHRTSPRADKPFVVVHAAALPESLLESELFGYEKGAFTGAAGRKPGRLETAEGGTLFLDEIGEISPPFQVKLLRFLQEKTFVRLGGTEEKTVDTRIIAATNRNLQQEVAAGHFREDLYYRLSVFPITVPPLRERKSDIKHLARHALARLGYNQELGSEVEALLKDYDWPGNVRELENVLERAVILARGDEIGLQHVQLPEPVLVRPGSSEGRNRTSLAAMEEEMLHDALGRAGGNKTKAARLLGITRRMLYTKLDRFGIQYDDEQ
jgi:DNA-binding NtrC family response regulator